MTAALIGGRAALNAYLRRDGRHLARDIALLIFQDEDRLADHEVGFDCDLPPAVEYELSKLITARNLDRA